MVLSTMAAGAKQDGLSGSETTNFTKNGKRENIQQAAVLWVITEVKGE